MAASDRTLLQWSDTHSVTRFEIRTFQKPADVANVTLAYRLKRNLTQLSCRDLAVFLPVSISADVVSSIAWFGLELSTGSPSMRVIKCARTRARCAPVGARDRYGHLYQQGKYGGRSYLYPRELAPRHFPPQS